MLEFAQAQTHDDVETLKLPRICAGGQVEQYQPTSEVDQYDPATNTWIAVKSLPQPRQSGTIQPIGHKVLIAYGATQTTEPQTDAWAGQLRTSG